MHILAYTPKNGCAALYTGYKAYLPILIIIIHGAMYVWRLNMQFVFLVYTLSEPKRTKVKVIGWI